MDSSLLSSWMGRSACDMNWKSSEESAADRGGSRVVEVSGDLRVELLKEPRRLRANLDCRIFFEVDVWLATSPSIDLWRKQRRPRRGQL